MTRVHLWAASHEDKDRNLAKEEVAVAKETPACPIYGRIPMNPRVVGLEKLPLSAYSSEQHPRGCVLLFDILRTLLSKHESLALPLFMSSQEE